MSLEIVREGRVMRLTLNSPETRNALTAALCRALTDALEEAAADAKTGAVLLEAKGQFFSVGVDAEHASGALERLFGIRDRIRKPILAAIQGPALSGGLGLIANSHVGIAAQGTSFGLTKLRVGLFPFAVFRSIALAVGERRAVELSLTNRIFGTNEALQWGFIHEVAPAVELEDRALALATALAESSPHAVMHGLEFVQRIRGMGAGEAGDLAMHFRSAAVRSPDYAEGLRALAENRPPRWPSLDDDCL